MRRLLATTLTIVFLTTVVLSGTAFAAIGTGAEDHVVEENILLADTLHSSENGAETGFAFDGDEVYTQNGATVTVIKDANNNGSGFIHKYDGSKLTYHGTDSANNSNSKMNICFLPGDNNVSDGVEYLEFNVDTNAASRTYLSMLNDTTTLNTLCWADSSFIGGLVRIEIDRRNGSLTADGKAPVSIYLNGSILGTNSVDPSVYGITIDIAAYKTPVITISSVKYGYIKSTFVPALNYTQHSAVLLNTLNASADGSAHKLVYNGDETHNQNGAVVTVVKDAANASDYGFINSYDGTKLTYHGANDSANSSNSGVSVMVAPGSNDVSNSLEYLTFKLKSNAPTRTYAKIKCGTADVMILNWANSNIATNTDQIVRIELDRRTSAITSDGKAPISVYLDSVLKHSGLVDASNNGLGIWLASYKTPTVTISAVEYGYKKSLVNIVPWLTTLHNNGGNGTKILYNGDETHSENGISIKVVADGSNAGTGYINKYDGSKLTYHGNDDSAREDNSGVSLEFDNGTNNYENKIGYLSFNISTNAPGRTYARVFFGDKMLCIVSHANTELVTNQNHLVEVELDSREAVLTNGVAAKATVYVDGVDVSRVDVPEGIDGKLRLWLAAYKTPTVTISNVKYGVKELNGNVGQIVLDKENNVAKVKVLNPVIEGVGQYGNNVCLFIAQYNDSNKLIALTPMSGEYIVGEAELQTSYTPASGATQTKTFLWDLSSIKPLCEIAD